MRSNIIYLYNYPKCQLGTYVGCTERMLKVRIDGHRGVSHRTGLPLLTKEALSIRNHALSCKCSISYNDFKILDQMGTKEDLLISESLFIKQLHPTLNCDLSYVPLYIS